MLLKSASYLVGLVFSCVYAAAYAQESVNDSSFNAQDQVINQDLQAHQGTGDFGRVGSRGISGAPGEMGPQADVELNHYVLGLGIELKVRNAQLSRDPTGFR